MYWLLHRLSGRNNVHVIVSRMSALGKESHFRIVSCSHNITETSMCWKRVCVTRTVPASVPTTAHGISMAALLPLAAGEAARGSFLRAVAVASHAALLIIAAWRHLHKECTCLLNPFYSVYKKITRWTSTRLSFYLAKGEVHHFSGNRLNEQLSPKLNTWI